MPILKGTLCDDTVIRGLRVLSGRSPDAGYGGDLLNHEAPSIDCLPLTNNQ